MITYPVDTVKYYLNLFLKRFYALCKQKHLFGIVRVEEKLTRAIGQLLKVEPLASLKQFILKIGFIAYADL